MMQTVLSLETSCDETAVAVVRRDGEKFQVLANFIASQAEEHAQWGGVVPEIASRRHLESMPLLLEKAIEKSGINFSDLDAVASTVTPGLTGALLVGSITARTLACLHNVPFLAIHHLEGHLSSVLLSDNCPKQPYLVLLVSGGHTELVKVDKGMSFQRLGRSHDDAAGEAFDKVARLLGLSYPGGPAIQAIGKLGNPLRFTFPRGRVSKPSGGYYPYDFSFSGLKTSVMRKVDSINKSSKKLPVNDLAASFELAVADVLVERSLKCAIDHDLSSLVIVGGVAANSRLRELMQKKASENLVNICFAPKKFCTDNAAMIGAAALSRLKNGNIFSSIDLGVSGRFPLDQAKLLYGQDIPF